MAAGCRGLGPAHGLAHHFLCQEQVLSEHGGHQAVGAPSFYALPTPNT